MYPGTCTRWYKCTSTGYKYKFYTVSFQLKSFLFFYFLFCSTTNILVKVRYSDSTSDNRALFYLQVLFFWRSFYFFFDFFFLSRNREKQGGTLQEDRHVLLCCCGGGGCPRRTIIESSTSNRDPICSHRCSPGSCVQDRLHVSIVLNSAVRQI